MSVPVAGLRCSDIFLGSGHWEEWVLIVETGSVEGVTRERERLAFKLRD